MLQYPLERTIEAASARRETGKIGAVATASESAPRPPMHRRIPYALVLLVATPGALCAQADGTEVQKLIVSPTSSFATFGRSASLEGDVALITANGADNQGAGYVFRRSSGTWSLSQKLTGSDTLQGDFFGFSSALRGSVAVVGANQHDALGFNSGAAYVFRESAGSFGQSQKLLAFDGGPSDYFGYTVAVGGDLLVVGAIGDSPNGAFSGSAYVYRDVGGTYVFEQKLISPTAGVEDQFGWSVATDGTRIAVSAILDEPAGSGPDVGVVSIWTKSGAAWVESARIEPADGAADDNFGWDLALDGARLAIGAPHHGNPVASGGAIYVYRDEAGAWTLEQKVTPVKLAADDVLGWSVALDGDRLVGGGPSLPGAVWGFHFDGTRWVDVHRWRTSDTESPTFPPAAFGSACAIDGTTVFGGAPFHDGGADNSGAVYRCEFSDLGLQATPASVPSGADLKLTVFGGLAGYPGGVLLQSLGGSAANSVLFVGSFDALGRLTRTLTVPNGLGGQTAVLLGGGVWVQPLALGFSSSLLVPLL